MVFFCLNHTKFDTTCGKSTTEANILSCEKKLKYMYNNNTLLVIL